MDVSEIRNLRRQLAGHIEAIDQALAMDEAIGLAFAERTGRELPPGGEYTAADAARATEIMRLFPQIRVTL